MNALLPISIIIIIFHLIASGIVWVILQELTKKSSFRNSESLDKAGDRYPWILSLLLTLSLLLPFMRGYLEPDIRNYGIALSSFLFIACASGFFSLCCWIKMMKKPELRTIHLAIIGMLTSAISLIFVFLAGAASPV
tara:strand:+ start:136 stop:546 length:411 start_codon:yes stop_codon:yes gene_type:complete